MWAAQGWAVGSGQGGMTAGCGSPSLVALLGAVTECHPLSPEGLQEGPHGFVRAVPAVRVIDHSITEVGRALSDPSVQPHCAHHRTPQCHIPTVPEHLRDGDPIAPQAAYASLLFGEQIHF